MSTSATTAMTLADEIAYAIRDQGQNKKMDLRDGAALIQACALVGIAEGVRRIAAEMERRSS